MRESKTAYVCMLEKPLDKGNRMKTLMKSYWKGDFLQMYKQEAILSTLRGATCQSHHNLFGLTKLCTRIVAKIKSVLVLHTSKAFGDVEV